MVDLGSMSREKSDCNIMVLIYYRSKKREAEVDEAFFMQVTQNI